MTYDVHVVLKLSIPVEATSETDAERIALHDGLLERHLTDGNYEVDVQHVEKVID